MYNYQGFKAVKRKVKNPLETIRLLKVGPGHWL